MGFKHIQQGSNKEPKATQRGEGIPIIELGGVLIGRDLGPFWGREVGTLVMGVVLGL